MLASAAPSPAGFTSTSYFRRVGVRVSSIGVPVRMRFQCGGAQELKWGSDFGGLGGDRCGAENREAAGEPDRGTSISDQPDTMSDGIGSNLRNSHGHHCPGHGDLRPVKSSRHPLPASHDRTVRRASNFSSWQRSCRNAQSVAHTAGDRNLVLTTVWRGYSPLAGSSDHYRSQTQRSKGRWPDRAATGAPAR